VGRCKRGLEYRFQAGDRQAPIVARTAARHPKLPSGSIEYFGYLRRNPNDTPDNNFTGYNFWLNKLTQFNGDFLKAEMVKAFIESQVQLKFGDSLASVAKLLNEG